MRKLLLLVAVLCMLCVGCPAPRKSPTGNNDNTVQCKGMKMVMDGVHYHVFFARGVDGNHVDIEVVRVGQINIERETP